MVLNLDHSHISDAINAVVHKAMDMNLPWE